MNYKKIALITTIILFFHISNVIAKEQSIPESFQNHQKIIVVTTEDAPKAHVYIPKKIIYKKVTKKKKYSENDILYFTVSGIKFEVFYGQGASAGGRFTISVEKNSHKFKRSIVTEKVYVSNSGNIYTESRYGFSYNKKRKFVIDEKGIMEKKQPFYLLDTQCIVNKTISLMSKRCLDGEVIAVIPKGMFVRVLLVEESSPNKCNKGNNYLVSTSFGLVGWVCSTPGHGEYGPRPQLGCLTDYGP